MRQTIDMPIVRTCAVRECAYNDDEHCRARAITVGDGAHPRCDTFFRSTTHATTMPETAGVGACKVAACAFNRDFECNAELVQIGHHADHADCLTFKNA